MINIGIDLGGTQLRLGEVDVRSGKLISKIISKDIKGVTENTGLLELTFESLLELGATPSNSKIGISAAGKIRGLSILGGPNYAIRGAITIVEELDNMKYKVALENDLFMAAQGVSIFEGRGSAVVQTYSSGHNTGVIKDGVALRDIETGHVPYRFVSDWKWSTPPWCGCSKDNTKNCVEAFVSGNATGRMFVAAYNDNEVTANHSAFRYLIERLQKKGESVKIEDLQDTEKKGGLLGRLTSEHVYHAHTISPDKVTKRIREMQEKAIAYAIRDAAFYYGPDRITIIGGLAKNWWPILFVPAIERAKTLGSRMLSIPEVSLTTLPEPGIIGAAAYAHRTIKD